MSAEAVAAPAARTLHLATVDDYLGPGDRRFFGSGYRRVAYDVVDLTLSSGDGIDGPAEGTATVTLEYPADWSSKKGVDMRPHLSSVDILVLGAQLAEACLVQAHGLSEADRRRSWVRKVKLRAGLEPQEELVGLPASATRRQVRAGDQPGRLVSVFDTKVGAMQARCEIDHPAGVDRTGFSGYARLEDVLGPAAGRHYGDGFKAKRPRIEGVHVDLDRLSAKASAVAQATTGAAAEPTGLEADHQPALSLVDTFVTCLQLAQVLMYEMDEIERGDSHTLWMLRTVLEASSPERPWDGPAPATATVVDRKLLPVGPRTFRTVDIEGGVGHVSLRASLAHALPQAHDPSPAATASPATPATATDSGRTS